MSWESPIQMDYSDLISEMIERQDGIVVKVGQTVCTKVDREELIRALKYDRGQYEKGYHDAMTGIIRCKDCRRFMPQTRFCTMGSMMYPDEDDFCSRGER